MDDLLVERVLTAVDQVPAGRVVSYGDLAELVGTGPRQVGSIMRHHGAAVTWWRVTNAYGDLPRHLRDEAFARWAEEGIVVKPNGLGCRITEHRCDLPQLLVDYERAVGLTAAPDAPAVDTTRRSRPRPSSPG